MANEYQWTVVNPRLENMSKAVKIYDSLGRRETSEQYIFGRHNMSFAKVSSIL